MLGPTVLHRDGMELSPGGLKQRTVLALLAAGGDRSVTIDQLIDGLYGDEPASGARRTVATYISNLRREMGDAIVRVGETYRLDADVRIDAREFEQLYRTGASLVADDPARASSALREGLGLWRGHAYVDVEARSALTAEIARLDEMRLSALDARIEADLALGLHRDMIGELEALTAEYPLREGFRAHHMRALYRSGRQSEALRAFGRTRQMLAEELGIDPSPELRDLELAILSQDPKLDVRIKARIERRAVLAAELDDSSRYASHRDRDAALVTRDDAFAAAVLGHGGEVLGVRGVAVYGSFGNVADAASAAAQLASGSLRLAVDHGEVEVADDDVSGPPIRRALRMAAIAHPGQVLLSAEAQSALASGLSAGWTVQSLGMHEIRGLDGSSQVFQLVGNGRPIDFPPLLIDRLPPPMPDARSGLVPGYELREEIEAGSAGALYRAYQATLGREVAIRVFRSELVSDPRFIRRFEAEAQRIAAVNHPHLVALLDFWRDPESAFMVHRLIEGDTLRAEMDHRSFDQAETVDLVARVAGAVRAGHGVEVAHGRLRPETILLDADANPYVADLGLVGMLHGLVSFPADAYTAPEALTGDPTPSSDIYSLGVLLAELVSGTPFPSDRPAPDVGGAVASVIERATAHDPMVRHDTVEEFVEDLQSAFGAPRPVSGDVRNPYKGLSAFQEADAGDFYGRAELVDHLAQAVLGRRLTVVVGPSGIGKSSVVRAGLIPRLRAEVPDLLITDMIPGPHPFDQLDGALARVAVEPPSDQVETIRSGRQSLSPVVAHLLPDGGELLLVVDQFEEVFTQVADDQERRRFLDMIVAEARSDASRVRIVLTLRADFFDRPLRHPEFGELMESAMVTVAAPTRDELSEIVVGPVGGVGVVVEEGLVAALVADAAGEAGGLPLLQHALTELFDRRQGNRLTLESYREAGGLSGSIGRRADATYAGLSDEDQATAREVFLRLVTVEEQAEDTRRRVRRSELMGMEAPTASVERVLDAFGRHRLLVFDRDAATRGPTVEVAHEALIQHWARLRAWVDEVRDDLLTRRRVEIATQDWLAAGEDRDLLLAGGRLEQAEGWKSRAGSVDEHQARFVSGEPDGCGCRHRPPPPHPPPSHDGAVRRPRPGGGVGIVRLGPTRGRGTGDHHRTLAGAGHSVRGGHRRGSGPGPQSGTGGI